MAGVDTPPPVPIPAAMYAGRFVFDVMKYTLAKCGHPKLENIRTTLEPNAYKRSNFVKIAGISVLRLALIMRDTWRRMFISRYQNSGLVGLDVPLFMSQIVKFCIFGRGKNLQSDVETMLALCHELTLFYFSKRMDYDINNVIGSLGGTLYFLLREHQNFKETLEELFDEFENLKEYSKALSNFIRRVAIPYGFRDNVSDLFYKELRQRRIDYVTSVECQKEPIKGLIDELGFLPLELYSAIAAEEAQKWPEHLKEIFEPPTPVVSQLLPEGSESGAVGGQIPRHRRSSHSKKTSEESRLNLSDDPPKSHESSERGGVEKRSDGTQSTTVSERRQQSITNPSELGTEDANLQEHSKVARAPTSAVSGESLPPSTLPASSESGGVEKISEGIQSTTVSEQIQQSKTNPLELGTEDAKLPEHSELACAPTSAVAVESPPLLTMPADSESGAIAKKKPRRRRSSRSKKTPEKSVPTLPAHPPISQAISESCDVEKKLFGRQLTAVSEQTTQSQLSISNPLEIEDALGRMNLGATGKSQQSQGTIPKSHQKGKLAKK